MIRELLNLVRELGYDTFRTDYLQKTLDLARKIQEFLSTNDITFVTALFPVLVPEWIEWGLESKGERIPSLPSGFEGGEIELNLKDSSDLETNYSLPNVNFNSKLLSPTDISTPVFYWGPSLSVSREGAERILKNGEIKGFLKVRRVCRAGKHFLAGNVENPKKIFVVHYDALWKGVIDNGLSVALFLSLLKEGIIKEDVVLFLGFSEISLWPNYWEYSMITAKESFDEQINNAEEVIVVDCIGYKDTNFIKDKEYIEAYSRIRRDLKVFGTPIERLMEIYHATNDGVEAVSLKQLEEDVRRVRDMISR
ncbi:hypothetical protein IPA_07430 [Ignicoccus pacificus DSM 13166]|uniref:Peptidase M28 domain-containing protein n=1 Tax=Ignicoccus pacificus DSM 13166 TaxID=940294 RepID=A0A977PLU4_9CREN|nr:hypothetical protein IPA_07430 [Ignicoccus pacificus DSM 13166]